MAAPDAVAVAAVMMAEAGWPAIEMTVVVAAAAGIAPIAAEDRRHRVRCRWTEWFEQKQLEGCFGAEWG